MATGDLHKTFYEDRTSGSRDMLVDRQTDKLIAILHSRPGQCNHPGAFAQPPVYRQALPRSP